MDRFELDSAVKEEIRARVLGEGFMKIVQTVRRGGKPFRIAMRPVEIGGERKFQAEMNDDGRVMVKNFSVDAAAEGLEEILNQRGARDLHLMTATGDLHLRVTKKGKQLVSRSAEMSRVAVVRPHDRVKKLPLNEFDSTALLKACGIADASGNVRASMRGKYDQVNEFLRAVGETVKSRDGESFTVVDCGCGKAYLTLALSCYLSEALGMKGVKVIGVDRRADVIDSARKMATRLDLSERAIFVEADIASYNPEKGEKVNMVVSLHACDTATDEALAKAVEWKVEYVLSVPCCQHELNKIIGAQRGVEGASVFSGLLRQSILRERMCDILTDSFRAMIMRILGFRTQVVEFVSHEATARNIMLRCEYGVKPGQSGPIGEYLALRDYWKVVPWLESRLGPLISRHLERYL
jgi:hypothetical protein